MAGLKATIERGGFDLTYWVAMEGSFNGFNRKMVVKFYGFKDKAAYEAGKSHFKGAEITKVFDWSVYDGSNLIQWVLNRARDPIYTDPIAKTGNTNIFKDALIDLA